MMQLGARDTAWQHKPTAKDYVQDGLVAMWDGIENAGWGIHDSTATTWKELTGVFPYTISIPSTVSWSSNGLKNPGTSTVLVFKTPISTLMSFYISMGLLRWTDNTYARLVGNFTQEGVESFTQTEGTPGGLDLHYATANEAFSTQNAWNAFKLVFAPANDWSAFNNRRGYAFSSDDYGKPMSYSGIGKPNGGSLLYVHRAVAASSSASISDSVASWHTGYDTRFNILPGNTLHSIRLYSRALSEKAVLHNYKVDIERFGQA